MSNLLLLLLLLPLPLSSATPVCRRSIGGRDSGAIEKNKIGNERQLRSVYDDTEVKSVEKSSHTHTGHFALHRCDRFIANWIDWSRRRDFPRLRFSHPLLIETSVRSCIAVYLQIRIRSAATIASSLIHITLTRPRLNVIRTNSSKHKPSLRLTQPCLICQRTFASAISLYDGKVMDQQAALRLRAEGVRRSNFIL